MNNPTVHESQQEGYHQLAMMMGARPALFLCRKFMTLRAYTVLALHAELIALEAEHAEIAHQDRISQDKEKQSFHCRFFRMRAAFNDPDKGSQYHKVCEIQAKLVEFDAACARFAELASAPAVNTKALACVREWLENKTGGKGIIRGPEVYPWTKDKYTHDLRSLLPEDKNKDIVSKWIEDIGVYIYHDMLGHRLHNPIILPEAPDLKQSLYYYSPERISNAIDVLVTILSSLLPTIPFFTLYYIHSPLGKMGAIVGFTFLFSVVLNLLAKERRIDCFTAASAFAAVQVVFLGTGTQTLSS